MIEVKGETSRELTSDGYVERNGAGPSKLPGANETIEGGHADVADSINSTIAIEHGEGGGANDDLVLAERAHRGGAVRERYLFFMNLFR